ncbi:hypothetical protein [Allokutzneria sp. NRRL B-24872]|uniref:type IV toxin-antitoxin system AbiEi family antitoxin domain-containing protein n=1 Tax=Allokutzneria sp. NRRL B-24872 TaxID=1137961 RepID=UPI000A361DB4|nr:hypothetical protein [Allokutzneria sp. NRRL B-24872]
MSDELSGLPAYFTADEAAAVGLDEARLRSLIAAGELAKREDLDHYHRTGHRESLWLHIHDATAYVSGSVACLGSALARHHLTDVIPKRVQVAVPRGTVVERLPWFPIEVIEFDARTFKVGWQMDEVNRGCDAPVYSRYRALVDAIVRRDHISEDIAREAVRRYKTNPANQHELTKQELTETAVMLGVERQVAEFMESTT